MSVHRVLVAGVDSSTQNCKIVICDAQTGEEVRTGRANHPVGTEIDPEQWWIALNLAIERAGGLADVAAISIAAQQHAMIVLDAQGVTIRPALLWNDTRSAQAATDLINEIGDADYIRRTGIKPVASFTAAKLRWLRDHEPVHAARVAAVALPHDWLSWRLRGFGSADTPNAVHSDHSVGPRSSRRNSSRNQYPGCGRCRRQRCGGAGAGAGTG